VVFSESKNNEINLKNFVFFATILCHFRELMMAFGVPIFDRYSVVLQIFKDRARTREAKLQVAFAEIPYLRYIYLFFLL
jgi:50S ribosomal subunit-associated GTPase HflX